MKRPRYASIITRELIRFDIDIAALAETRRPVYSETRQARNTIFGKLCALGRTYRGMFLLVITGKIIAKILRGRREEI